MEQVEKKQLKEIFKDFNYNSYILNSKIQDINLYKKKNMLEIKIETDRIISIKDINAFEKYLTKRFLLQDVSIIVKYEEGIDADFISEWENILEYLSYKHPLTKALLKNSKIEIDNNKVNINLPFSGSDILNAQGINSIISDIIFKTYSKKYKVNFIDNTSESIKKTYQETTKKMQDNIILEFKNKLEEEDKASDGKNENQMQNKNEENKTQNENKIKEITAKNSDNNQTEENIEPEEITPLILGRNQNIKEQLTKIIDVSIDSGKICLEGEIINTDSRELKSGKFLFMFDLYDGTSTITCKAFIEKDKFKTITRKN